jgi:GTP cyclohydrolase II
MPSSSRRLWTPAGGLTSTAFAARMCDCGQQITVGVDQAATRPGTVLIYLPQEGRGQAC